MVYEIKGDALSGLGNTKLALDQYNLALQNMADESQKSLLNIKINFPEISQGKLKNNLKKGCIGGAWGLLGHVKFAIIHAWQYLLLTWELQNEV